MYLTPGKKDSTQVSNVVQEVFTDTIDEIYSPVDTIANMLTGIHDKVLQTQQQQQRTLNARTNRLRIAGSNLSKRVNQLLESIELDEQSASHKKLEQELISGTRPHGPCYHSILAVILVLCSLPSSGVTLPEATITGKNWKKPNYMLRIFW